MIINHNIAAINASRVLTDNAINTQTVTEKLSSGLRINRGADDAAGLAVSEKMRAQIRGLNMAYRNAQDGVSLIQTAEGHLQETTAAIQRLRELSVQAANGTLQTEDRSYINKEATELISEIDRIAKQAQFNRLDLFHGDFADKPSETAGAATTTAATPAKPMYEGGGIPLHIGANADQKITVFINDMSAGALGLAKPNQAAVDKSSAGTGSDIESDMPLDTAENANKALLKLDTALETVNKERTRMGAYQNRLDMAMKGISVASENLQASESRIRDTDMAKEMIDFVKLNILSQSGTSMLAQSNLRPQLVLRVLG